MRSEELPVDESAIVPVMEQLKSETAVLHESAERSPFQRNFAAGRLSVQQYAAYLGQLEHVHRVVENGLRTLLERKPELESVIRPPQFRAAALASDLTALGTEPAQPMLASTAAVVAGIQSACSGTPLAALGYHYVLEGSTNGSRYFAEKIRRTYALVEGRGAAYLDPYGAEQPAAWAEFRRAMNATSFADPERVLLVRCAKDMFEGIRQIGDDLDAQNA